jgi:tetratricopeptide (TPR) repeat protein
VQQACRSAPTDRTLLVGGHNLLVGLDSLREAAALWAQALRLEPEAADLAAWYAWTSALAGQWEAASKGAGAALNRDPGQSLASAVLVLADLAANNPDRATDRLDQLLSEPASPADTPQRLLAAITRIGQRDPEDPWPYYVAARLLIAQGDTESARLAIEEFASRAPSPEWRSRAEELLQPVE